MILVTGATGTVGSEVVKQLVAAGQKVRALVRDPQKAKLGAGVEVVAGDLTKPETLAPALAGVDKVFALSAGNIPEQEGNLVAAAKKAGVKHIVKLSVAGADFEPGISFGRWHRASEKNIEGSGISWTHIRPVGFMSNAFQWAGTIKSQGAFYQPAGNGKQALIDPKDIAAFAVKMLTSDGHAGKAYEISSEALTMAEQAKILSEALGKPVNYVDVPDDAARSGMAQSGMPQMLIDAVLELFGLIKAGYAGNVTDNFEKVMGRKPRRFSDWVKDNIAAFR